MRLPPLDRFPRAPRDVENEDLTAEIISESAASAQSRTLPQSVALTSTGLPRETGWDRELPSQDG